MKKTISTVLLSFISIALSATSGTYVSEWQGQPEVYKLHKQNGHYYFNTQMEGKVVEIMLESAVLGLLVDEGAFKEQFGAFGIDSLGEESGKKLRMMGNVYDIAYIKPVNVRIGDGFFSGNVFVLKGYDRVALPLQYFSCVDSTRPYLKINLAEYEMSFTGDEQWTDNTDYESFNLNLSGGMPVVETAVELFSQGKVGNIEKSEYILDFGNSSLAFLMKGNQSVDNMLDKSDIELLQAKNKSGDVVSEGIYAEKFTICGQQFKDASIGVSDKMKGFQKYSGLIGLKFFERPVVLDFKTGKIYLKKQSNHAYRIFETSECFDMLAALQYFDKLKNEPRFSHLATDTAFVSSLTEINSSVKASKLCNFYARFGHDRNNPDSLCAFFESVPEMSLPDEDWCKSIAGLHGDIARTLKALRAAGYHDYWEKEVKPKLEAGIASYPIPDGILDRIHDELTAFSGRDSLPPTHSRIYVMDIDNAFQLSDESFCCTPILLDPEFEKQFHLDFLKVYTHENLHRLPISRELMDRLDNLLADEFYSENEAVAASHNEGRNEAFVVAAEVYISNKLGRRDAASVCEEFKVYVDGSLVLAPIIYVNLDKKEADESLNDFIIRLFDSGVIEVGNVKAQYEASMKKLEESVSVAR